jgi:hypothetical protein
MLVSARDEGSALHDVVRRVERRRAAVAREAVRVSAAQVREALEQGGVAQLLRLGANRLAAPWAEFGSVTFFRRRLDGSREVPRPRPGLFVRRASVDDVALVLQASDPRRSRAIVEARLARGDLCLLAFDTAGRPVHSDWATVLGAHVPELGRDVTLREGEAYLYDAFTPPPRRGHGAFGFVLDHLFARLQAEGARVVYSYVRSDDPRGQRSACVRLRPVGTVFHVRLNGRTPMVFGGSREGLPTLVKS